MESVPIRGVLLDWRGTLVHDPDDAWWVGEALRRIGRSAAAEVVYPLCERLRDASELPEVRDAARIADCSPALHRAFAMLHFERAGFDTESALALYNLDFDVASHPFYPDVPVFLHALKAMGIRTALVSDIHFDLRPEFAAAGLASVIDAFVLSYEHGVQKPDPEIFEVALTALDLTAEETVMVGDRASRDGAATAVGVMTLILPPARNTGPRGLDRVLSLVR